MNEIESRPDSADFHEINYGSEFSLNTYSQKVLFENLNYLGKLKRNTVFSSNLFRENVSDLMIETAGRLAQELVKHGILNDKDFILELVKVINDIHVEDKIQISVNPMNYSLMKTIIPELNKSLKNNQDLEIICDENISINNFKVECGNTIINDDLLGKIRKLINILKYTHKINGDRELSGFDNDSIIKKQVKDLKYICGFDLLNDIDSEIIVNIIQHEHPQTISLILKKIDTSKAQEILERFPEETKTEIISRTNSNQKTPHNILEEVENNIYRLFGNEMFEKFTLTDGIGYVNRLLEQFKPDQKVKFLEDLKENNPNIAKKIKS